MGSAKGVWALLALLALVACTSQPSPGAETPTVAPPVAPTATRTASPRPTSSATPTDPATPPPTETPAPLPGSTLIAFCTNRDGNDEIYLLDSASGWLLNLTRNPADDRAPAWHPDGTALAFESRRDGNWEIYVLNLADGTLRRVTHHPAYDGAPAWSPDGSQLAFESYRDGNLEIYTVAASGGEPRRLTESKGGDYAPAWSPDGTTIAFTSWRDGNKEVYAIPAAGGEPQNLTRNAADDEAPAWSADGSALAFTSWRDVDSRTGNRNAEIYLLDRSTGSAARLTQSVWPDLDPSWDAQGALVWSAYSPGPPFETYDPYRPGDLHLWRLAGDGPERLTEGDWDERQPAPAPPRVTNLAALVAALPPLAPTSTPPPSPSAGGLAEVVEVPSILAAADGPPIEVNELVVPSLLAWQQAVLEASGWDLLHQTLGSWRSIDRVRKKPMYAYDYGYLSWHKAGRALDLPLEFKVDGVDQMVRVREDLGGQTYWRLYLRTARQDGSQGEPLKEKPWQFWWQIVPEEDPAAYDAGGRRLPIPEGYYVDITALAKRHGWERIASYAIEGDYHWSTDSNGTEYWHYERTDGLDWWQAMSQIYPAETLEEYVGWAAGLKKAQSEDMMRTKGVPTPQP